MKKLLAILVGLFVLPMAFANSISTGIGVDIETEDFAPLVWLCEDRVVLDDDVEPGRMCPTVDICEEDCNCTETPKTCGCCKPPECEWDQAVSSYVVDGMHLWERHNNYAFEGEQIVWDVLVMDKNGIEKIEDVFATIGDVQGAGNDIEVNCILDEIIHDASGNCVGRPRCEVIPWKPQCENWGCTWTAGGTIFSPGSCEGTPGWNSCADPGNPDYDWFQNPTDPADAKNVCQNELGCKWLPSCNARILEEELDDFYDNTAAFYKCILTVETPLSMYGEYWITVEATDLDGLSGTMDENEYWFLNPDIALTIDGSLVFENVRPGTQSYSETILVGNDADDGSGVTLDMFISGTNFYDSASSGAKCPTSNELALTNFRYFATNGAYSTQIAFPRTVNGNAPDAEGYMDIPYGQGWNDPYPFYGRAEIIPTAPNNQAMFSHGNFLTPGAEMALTFKLSLPEPCNGDFDTGSIYFYGEAV